MQYKVALVVGRFQPFHKGHLFLINQALEKADKIIIGIGSANISDENNPFDFEARKKIIKAVFYKEGVEKRLIKVVPLDDFLDDKKWLSNLEKQVGKFDLALGNNDWTNNILEEAGFKVLKVDYLKRGLYEGWRIRKLIREGKKWQARVPDYIAIWLYDYMVERYNNISIKQYNHVVLGGTFDRFHKGHEALLTRSFELGKKVTIGIATEELYKNKFLFETIEPFNVRKKNITDYINYHLNNDRAKMVKIISFSEFTGGADKIKDIDAIIVSRETFPNALKINELRKKNHLIPLMIVIIEDILAEDGKLISSERIRAGEIDREGNSYGLWVMSYLDKKINEIIMPEILRPMLQKPLGKVYQTTKQLLQSIKRLKYPILIAIGDIIVDSLLKEGIDPDVKVIDFRSRREKYVGSDPFRYKKKGLTLVNNPGTINLKTAKVIQEKIKLALHKKEKSWIVIDGEEDLLALPAILFAPLKSLVLYGHWQLGIIAVSIDEKIKDKARKILLKFE